MAFNKDDDALVAEFEYAFKDYLARLMDLRQNPSDPGAQRAFGQADRRLEEVRQKVRPRIVPLQ